MDVIELFAQNLLSPSILFFALGIFAGFVKSDLEIPDSISKFLSIYLMMAIGFKGGVAIAQTPEINQEVISTIIAGLAIGFFQPFLGYLLLNLTTKLDTATKAAISAHYGSISMVTFVTAASFLDANAIIYSGYIIAVLALMEAPAIFSGLYIANRDAPEIVAGNSKKGGHLSREILANGAILLLIGSFLVGWITGEKGLTKMEGFLVEPFKGILALFLLDMGLLVSRQFHHLKQITFKLILFGIYMPILGAIFGLISSMVIGLNVGTAMLFIVLCASASYIAVPAAMRIALPQAKAAIYVPMSLVITFPFNIVIGIPLYYSLAESLLK